MHGHLACQSCAAYVSMVLPVLTISPPTINALWSLSPSDEAVVLGLTCKEKSDLQYRDGWKINKDGNKSASSLIWSLSLQIRLCYFPVHDLPGHAQCYGNSTDWKQCPAGIPDLDPDLIYAPTWALTWTWRKSGGDLHMPAQCWQGIGEELVLQPSSGQTYRRVKTHAPWCG